MNNDNAGAVVYREDYAPWPWRLMNATLRFDIGSDFTRVISRLELEPNPLAARSGSIELDGSGLELVSLKLDGRLLEPQESERIGERLSIPAGNGPHVLETEVRIYPDENTALEGLYRSGDFLLTQ